ncbi:MAG: FAD:protein FMN transferase [Piscirickettsiaceae bacterium CG_4_9_14_3_um_filter_43_564]|nr:FAD:protein FMN transferase [Thiomicrospira sp.]OIP95289.1 MAG: lipoprotein ApbE [Thiomicrospira sp. CG2_30_44_34]PIQ02994.1 MAG: lipoprotein ApbE [Piscirickettsiaceae bacterium CG18_big_fil_WC_8_21_14_2_50_44_103]PIU38530.1 MAG: FAD:protein FMN transferase [Piscirickettsiaceae bacterium CG07_land_8_20_14_0_80_44_28]PIW57355.1 MAG: FAD:protein FMN transferase [Piscirickettsiaceae bacterium CG12_big_fil_rev_8_21_14_0_65_44_934]PIW77479.1 MAG: FAD:protein FMN transferase [Piscirickettsiaceae 
MPLKRVFTLKIGQAWLFLTILSSVFWLPACTPSTLPPVQQTFYVFGTEVNVEIVDTPKAKALTAITAIEQRFHQFNRDWHAWEKGGILSQINQAIANGKPIDVPETVKQFIVKSQQLAAQSDYLFDPGIGQLIALWGFHSEDWQGPPPTEADIQAWLNQRPSIKALYFKGTQLYSHNPKVQLDFGGNAKGLALDIAIQTLKKSGINNAIVNIGGDMRIIGTKAPQDAQSHGEQQAWHIGIQDPDQPQKPIAWMAVSGDESIVTSGSYQRFFEWQGQRYSHIINPNTGYPAQPFLSVTVIHSDATTADAAATALMIAGPEKWQKIAQQMGIRLAVLIDPNRKIYFTPDMASRLHLLEH